MRPIYMDNAASTKTNPNVLKKFNEAVENLYANPSSEHFAGLNAERYIRTVQEDIANKLHCKANEIFFTTGATMSNNLLIQGMLRKHPETMFVTSTVEHNDIMMLYDWLPYTKRLIDVGKESGIVDIDQLAEYLAICMSRGVPCLVSIQMANSETGIIQPIKQISDIVHTYENGYLHVDATQYIPYYPINIEQLKIDALSMSGQKIGGIKGSGLLVVRQILQNNIAPIIFGEQGLVGGTPSTPLIVSLGEAFNGLEANYKSVSLQDKRDYLLTCLTQMGGILVGTKDNRLPNNIFIRFPGVNGLSLMHLLSDKKIYIGTGSACSTDSDRPSHVALAYGLTEEETFECIRFTLCNETTYEEIEYVVTVLKGILPLLQ